jgi:hypothetical protein
LRYQIVCNGEVIGSSNLEWRDESLGEASGPFEPTAAYERVRPVFRLFIEARADGESEPNAAKLAAYEREREKLVLSVQDEHGQNLHGAGVAILDYSATAEAGDEPYEVEVYFATPRHFAQLAPLN